MEAFGTDNVISIDTSWEMYLDCRKLLFFFLPGRLRQQQKLVLILKLALLLQTSQPILNE